MTTVSARDALLYATNDAMLKLYRVLIGSWILVFFSQFVLQTSIQPIVQFGAVVLLLASGVAFITGVVAIAHKVLAES
ncbi:hypothetical protein ACFFQF_08025 [Haladaptatus pallidirubidus]|uniref:Uncharacterized protein n=1 Tax=Haladaptatus pallidirubidus TaxID=1008152 RepID=A0AAV3UFY5_9EURY|nr:hypothetical protein [Haladaptatus pallidirubidus]